MKILRIITILFFCLSASVLPAANVEMDKIRFTAGAGNSVSAIVVKWNETGDRAKNIDALVWGVRHDGNATAGEILATLLASDIRLAAVECDGIKALSFATYTRRNMVSRIKIGTSSKTVGASGIYTVSETDLAKAAPMYASDKWQLDGRVWQWHFFIKRAGDDSFVLADAATAVSDGDVIMVDYGTGAAVSSCPYLFYVPPYDGAEYIGCYVPDIEVNSSEQAVIPFYFNAYSAAKAPGTGNWPARITVSPSGVLSGMSAAFNPASTANLSKYYFTAKPAVSEGEAVVTVAWQGQEKDFYPSSPRAPFSGTIKVTSNDCKLEKIAFNPSQITLNLGQNRVVKPVLSPASATDEPLAVSVSGIAVKYDLGTGRLETVCTGTAVITVSAVNSPSVKASLTVTVAPPARPLTQLTFSPAEQTLKKGSSMRLSPVLTPADADYTKLNWISDNVFVASVDASGLVTAKNTGTATLTATYDYDTKVKAQVKINVVAANPVTQIDFSSALGDDGVIHVPYGGVLALKPEVLPVSADMREFDVIIGNEDIASTYTVAAFDYFLKKYPELIARSAGSTTLQFRALDGSQTMSPVYKLTVDALDRTVPSQNEYRDGFFWLSEDWFTHCNGSMNYVDAAKNVHYRAYEAQNPGYTFGATTQYGLVWGDRLYVLSKEASDAGDPRHGDGRLVVADATTLRRITSHASLGGDSRACAGATSEKIYIGLSNGVVPYYVTSDKMGAKLDLSGSGDDSDLYNRQTGDMACTATHLWVIRQDTGTFAVDIETDRTVAFFDGYKPHALTQSADGNIWVAADGRQLICYDAVTLEEIKRIDNVDITCDWSTWRSPSFCGALNENVLFWMSGNTLYSYDIDNDIRRVVYTHTPQTLPQYGDSNKAVPYGSGRYDNAAGQWVFATALSGSSLYSHVWYNFVDVATGQLARDIMLDRYYWFPAIPVFPHRLPADNAVLFEKEPIYMSYDWGDKVVDLRDYIHDPSAIDSNIRFLSVDCGRAYGYLDGHNLVARNLWVGTNHVKVTGESAGRPFEAVLSFKVPDYVGVTSVDAAKPLLVKAVNGGLEIRGCKDVAVRIFSAAGKCVAEAVPDSDAAFVPLSVANGVYIVCAANGCTEKVVLR